VRVEKALAEHNSKVLLVTSTIPNEGKTTLSVNLAVALAQKGKKVLLMDCDLRNPSVGSALGLGKKAGFAEFLKGEISAKEIMQTWGTEELHVVLAGNGVSNPGMLLAQKNAKMFVEKMREAFDYVILDTPPCAMMADAAEIGEYADAALLTVRFDYALRQQIQEAVQSLSDNEKPIIGTVFNMANPKRGKGSYGGYYGYGQYGSYGYEGRKKEGK
jgi:capsular exopolysaccharide synthesis family protein